jgi:hypothetical protein
MKPKQPKKRTIEPGKAHPDALKCAQWLNGDEKGRFLTRLHNLYDSAVDEISDLEATNSLRWSADQRAIKRWQCAAGPHQDRTHVWPDQADLCVWLLGKLEKAERALREGQKTVLKRKLPPKTQKLSE